MNGHKLMLYSEVKISSFRSLIVQHPRVYRQDTWNVKMTRPFFLFQKFLTSGPKTCLCLSCHWQIDFIRLFWTLRTGLRKPFTLRSIHFVYYIWKVMPIIQYFYRGAILWCMQQLYQHNKQRHLIAFILLFTWYIPEAWQKELSAHPIAVTMSTQICPKRQK